ncbi:MAG: class I SAM-dependent methyltransferase [Candidatus Levybacteria bacterium]|nr:class I SAM-dependent methyltransferase [Candidatus Levybacteria bacterium]
MTNKIIDYDEFHNTTSVQTKIIRNNNFTYKTILKIIDNYLGLSKNILDIGSGAGSLCLYYANKGYKVLGLDISEKAVENATQSARYLKLTNVKFTKMNFPEEIPNEKFDFIILTEVIEHLKDDNLAIKKIFSILNSKGMLVISTPSQNAPLYRLGLAKEFDMKVGHLRRYTVKELKSLCLKNGFEVVYIKKTEGIIRNYLFINSFAGKLVRFIKFFISDIVMFIDNLTIPFSGESNIIIVARKR